MVETDRQLFRRAPWWRRYFLGRPLPQAVGRRAMGYNDAWRQRVFLGVLLLCLLVDSLSNV
jgi:hypothetical protein